VNLQSDVTHGPDLSAPHTSGAEAALAAATTSSAEASTAAGDAPSGEASASHVSTNPTPCLALLSAHDKHHRNHVEHRVTRWPVMVGRALDCDWVIDDPHLAAHHLRIAPDAQGQLQVQVLPSHNGIHQGKTLHAAGSQFAWGAGQELQLGRLGFSARMQHEAVAPELALRRGWRTWLRSGVMTGAAILALLAYLVVAAWLPGTEGSIWPSLLSTGVSTLAALLIWAGLWAVVGKVFAGRMRYAKHVKIAAVGFALTSLFAVVLQVLAFALSLESLVKYEVYISVLLFAVVVWWHLKWALPISRQRITAVMVGLVVTGMAVTMGLQWQSQKRLSNNLYMGTMLPPNWRIAPAVPASQWLNESLDLKARLEQRLSDEKDDDSPEFDELD